jgi:hypothetical protein
MSVDETSLFTCLAKRDWVVKSLIVWFAHFYLPVSLIFLLCSLEVRRFDHPSKNAVVLALEPPNPGKFSIRFVSRPLALLVHEQKSSHCRPWGCSGASRDLYQKLCPQLVDPRGLNQLQSTHRTIVLREKSIPPFPSSYLVTESALDVGERLSM